MSGINLIVDGVEIPFQASHSISQSYTPILAETLLRMEDRSAVKQSSPGKDRMRIETNGTGHIPLPLEAIDYKKSFVLACSDALIKYSQLNVFDLPASRRLDVDCAGFAVVDGKAIRSSLSIAGDTATVTAVVGATAYQVAYFPTFTVFAQRPTETGASRSVNGRSWALICEEI